MKTMNKIKSKKEDTLTMEDLSVIKMQIKERIDFQRGQVQYSARHLFTPSAPMNLFSTLTNMTAAATSIAYGTKKMSQGASIVSGVIFGYKAAKKIVQFIKDKKKK